MTETNANWEVKKQIKQTQSTYYLFNDLSSGQEKLELGIRSFHQKYEKIYQNVRRIM